MSRAAPFYLKLKKELTEQFVLKPQQLVHRAPKFGVKFPRITMVIDRFNPKLAQNQINISENTPRSFTPPKAVFEINSSGLCFVFSLYFGIKGAGAVAQPWNLLLITWREGMAARPLV